jgi:CSLREA domain-containing protein
MFAVPSVTATLDAWFDWNRDGDWDDDGEWMIKRERVTPQADTVAVAVPATAAPGFTFSRFRFSANGVNGPGGFAPQGEVEDYLMLTLADRPVGSSGDGGDSNPGDGVCDDGAGNCTLRAAIQEANASGQPTVLSFASFSKRRTVVTPQSALPAFTAPIVVQGGGQLEIDGSQAGTDAHGLDIQSSGSAVFNTVLRSFGGDGIRIAGNRNRVVGDSLVDNGGAGVRVVSGRANSVRQTLLSGNGGGGIDLGTDGPTANDSGDGDSGPNDLQNSPELSEATFENATVSGTMSSVANASFQLEFFASSGCGVSSESHRYLGSGSVTTGATGSGAFAVEVDAFLAGDGITATATDAAGNTSELSACVAGVSTTIERLPTEIPEGYRLEQNYPNPFNPVTTIRFAVPQSEAVRIDVYDVVGQHVATVVNGRVEAGEFEVRFDARNLPSGVYVYRMVAAGFSASQTFTLLRE